jgi:hypothetical protein
MVRSGTQNPEDALSKGRSIQETSVGDTSVGDELSLHQIYVIWMAYLPAIGADEALRVELVGHGSDDPPGDELVAHVAVVLCPLVVFCKSLKQIKKKTFYSYLQRYIR